MESVRPSRLDLRGHRCPIPVIRTESAMRRLARGARLVVVADDPVAAVDIPHFCARAGHAVRRLPDEEGAAVFEITRDAGALDACGEEDG